MPIATRKAGLDHEEAEWMLTAEQSGVHRQLGYASFCQYLEFVFGYSTRIGTRMHCRLESCRVKGAMRWAWFMGMAVAATIGCGDSESSTNEDGSGGSGGGGGGTTCGTFTAPTMLAVTGVTPAAGTSVDNSDIVHSFTVLGGGPIAFDDVNFELPGAEHSAGNATGASQFMTSTMGVDLEVTFSPMTWEIAPADVYVVVQQRYKDADGCEYLLPRPLFDYAITAGTGGAGGN